MNIDELLTDLADRIREDRLLGLMQESVRFHVKHGGRRTLQVTWTVELCQELHCFYHPSVFKRTPTLVTRMDVRRYGIVPTDRRADPGVHARADDCVRRRTFPCYRSSWFAGA